MTNPLAAIWSIEGAEIKAALDRVAAGEHPEMVWLEMCAAAEVDYAPPEPPRP